MQVIASTQMTLSKGPYRMLPQAFPLLWSITLWLDAWLRPPCRGGQGHPGKPRILSDFFSMHAGV